MISEYQPKDSVVLISEIPQGIIVHDMVFDWSGKRIALACSDKTVKIYIKNHENAWQQESTIKIQGSSVWKMKWIRPQYGILLATCSLDRTVRINQWKMLNKTGVQKFQWQTHVQATRGIEDFKFSPSLQFGLIMSLATTQGVLELKQIKQSLQATVNSGIRSAKLEICKLGLNCLSWSKDYLKKYGVFAIGCKSNLTTPMKVLHGFKNKPEDEPIKIQPMSTVAFAYFDYENYSLQKINAPAFKDTKTAVNDISWAFVNGRSYHLLAIATDSYTKVFEVNVKAVEDLNGSSRTIQVMKQFNLAETPSYRLSWNVLGTYLSVSEKNHIKIFRCLSRGVWNCIKEITEQE